MKKGFTLIELIASIVILAIISIIAIPIFLNIIDDIRMKAYMENEESLAEAARYYLSINYIESPQNIGDQVVIPLKSLRQKDFIRSLKDVKDGKKDCDGYVVVRKQSADDYDYDSYINCSGNYQTQGYIEEIEFTKEGLILHLDAASLTLDNGETVLEWEDRSGNDRNATQTEPTNAPVYNNNRVVFDGVSTFMEMKGWPTTDDITAFYVINPYSLDGSRYLIGNSILAFFNGKPNIYVTNPWAWHSSTDVMPVNTETLLSVLISKNTGTTSFYYNGELINTIEQSVDPFGYGLSSTHFLGKRNGVADSEYNGEISEILIFDRALTEEEILLVEMYLTAKWF